MYLLDAGGNVVEEGEPVGDSRSSIEHVFERDNRVLIVATSVDPDVTFDYRLGLYCA